MSPREDAVVEEKEMSRQCVVIFEKRIADLIIVGAKTRSVAVKWLLESLDISDDLEYADYYFGMPYGTFAKELA
jgi:hypothetical protein